MKKITIEVTDDLYIKLKEEIDLLNKIYPEGITIGEFIIDIIQKRFYRFRT